MGEKQRSKRGDDRDLFHEKVGMQSGQRVQTPDQINKQTNKQELIEYGFLTKIWPHCEWERNNAPNAAMIVT